MSDEKVGYIGIRISQKQLKCRNTMGAVNKMRYEMGHQAKLVKGVPKLETMRGLKEIVSGLALPRKER